MLQGWLETDFVLQSLVSSFFAILFLQSGVDKLVDRAGNLEWLKGHFRNSVLAPFVPFLVLSLTVLEIVAGVLCAVGLAILLAGGTALVAHLGALCCGVTFLALFFGQRLAKDYAGAAALAPYFLVALAAVHVTRAK